MKVTVARIKGVVARVNNAECFDVRSIGLFPFVLVNFRKTASPIS